MTTLRKIEELTESVGKAPPEKRLEAAVRLENAIDEVCKRELRRADVRRARIERMCADKQRAAGERLGDALVVTAPAEEVCAEVAAETLAGALKNKGLCAFGSDGRPMPAIKGTWVWDAVDRVAKSPRALAELIKGGEVSSAHGVTVRALTKKECAACDREMRLSLWLPRRPDDRRAERGCGGKGVCL